MSDDPARWLRELAGDLHVDPGLPPGVVILESGTERIARTASHPGGLVTEALWEDLESYLESFPYFIRLSDASDPVGTLVMQVPESATGERRWKPGIWEHETYRRHTLRRCEWKAGQ